MKILKESLLDDEEVLLSDDTLIIKVWIENNCKINGNWTIKNSMIDVNGDVFITNSMDELPYPFGKVTGSFAVWANVKLKSLKNCPIEVKSFAISKYKGTTLEGSPKIVNDSYICSDAKNITSLEGISLEIKSNVILSSCEKLKTLKGLPKKIGGYLSCCNCKKLKTTDYWPNVLFVAQYQIQGTSIPPEYILPDNQHCPKTIIPPKYILPVAQKR